MIKNIGKFLAVIYGIFLVSLYFLGKIDTYTTQDG
jgi:hypothetical protein